jgi:hypothetical protein
MGKALSRTMMLAAVCSCLSVGTSARAVIRIVDAPSVNPWPVCDCSACERCQTILTPFYGVTHIDPPAIALPAPEGSFADAFSTAYRSWTLARPPAPLGGTITVTMSDAHVCDPYINDPRPAGARTSGVHCKHGAELRMSYAPGPGETPPVVQRADGTQLVLPEIHWIQKATWDGYGCTPQGPKNRIDATSPTHVPYYSWPIGNYLDAPQAGCARLNTQPQPPTWSSRCRVPGSGCPGPCRWKMEFETYVCYGTPGGTANPTGTVMVFDGVRWGLTALCNARPNPTAPATTGGVTKCPEVHFDPGTGALRFTDSVLDVLNLDGSRDMDAAFAGDPLMGATISLSDFTLFASGPDNTVLDGGVFRIHKNGVTYFEADLPNLIVDDDAIGEFGDNLFGQFGNPRFYHTDESPWLAAYEQTYLNRPDLLSEFRGRTSSPIEDSFRNLTPYDGRTTALTAFCEVPEPASLCLLGVGAMALMCCRPGRRPTGE